MLTKSDEIRNCRDGVVANPFQGKDKKVVFICSMGILRSATGARLYAHKYNTRSAGTWADALVPLTPVLIAWADQLVFVNKSNYDQARAKYVGTPLYHILTDKAKVLDIPDNYEHMHPKLIEAFEQQYERL